MGSVNHRKSQRRRIKVVGYLYTHDGWPIGECEMRDISSEGAQIAMKNLEELPNAFLLSLSRNGVVRRHCHLVWRNDEAAGVQFSTETLG
jgi:PilZ domain-containing protein